MCLSLQHRTRVSDIYKTDCCGQSQLRSRDGLSEGRELATHQDGSPGEVSHMTRNSCMAQQCAGRDSDVCGYDCGAERYAGSVEGCARIWSTRSG
jgi:hypothetical protein